MCVYTWLFYVWCVSGVVSCFSTDNLRKVNEDVGYDQQYMEAKCTYCEKTKSSCIKIDYKSKSIRIICKSDNLNELPDCLPNGFRELTIEECQITEFNDSFFGTFNVSKLEYLSLHHVGFREALTHPFKSLSKLKTLHLRHVKNIDMDSFNIALKSVVQQLVSLKVEYIHLEDTRTLINGLSSKTLKMLYISHTAINELNFAYFKGFENLKTLDLESNQISKIVSHAPMPKLKRLSLKGNHFQKGPPKFCSKHKTLNKMLYPRLESIDISYNYIPKIEGDDWTCLFGIKKLDIHYNHIKNLTFNMFSQLKSLTTLDLHSNWIEFIYIENNTVNIQELDLSHNNFNIQPLFCPNNRSSGFPNLTKLNLSLNGFRYLTNVSKWVCLKSLKQLNLTMVSLEEIGNTTLAVLTSLESLQLTGTVGGVENIVQHVLNISTLKILSLADNKFQFKDSNFKNMFNNSRAIESLDLSYNSLHNGTLLIEALYNLVNLTTLKLNRMNIKEFPWRLLSVLTKLEELNLNANQIESLQMNVSLNETKLKTFSVNKNKVRVISKDDIPYDLWRSLIDVDLSRNPFSCDCDVWFRKQIRKNGHIKGSTATLKNWPGSYSCGKVKFSDYELTEKNCEQNYYWIYITIGSFLLVFAVVSLTAYRIRWYILYCLHKLRNRQRTGEREPLLHPRISYDAYVIYTDDDRHFVHNEFLQVMENKYHYRLHIWHRDSVPGGTKFAVCTDGIDASNHAVMMLSGQSLADEWCDFQLYVALHNLKHEKQKKLMLVILDDLDVQGLSKSWCVLLTKLPTAHWCPDPEDIRRQVFEQKLKKSLGPPMSRSEPDPQLQGPDYCRP